MPPDLPPEVCWDSPAEKYVLLNPAHGLDIRNPFLSLAGTANNSASSSVNRIAATICELLEVNGTKLTVRGLDAFDGSPVLDIKPVFAEFIPDRQLIRQPTWSHEMMSHCFQKSC